MKQYCTSMTGKYFKNSHYFSYSTIHTKMTSYTGEDRNKLPHIEITKLCRILGLLLLLFSECACA